jgi:pyruvate decarboxylase
MAFKNPALPPSRVTVGAYLADRLATAGCGTVFSVPGDFTLTLLDELLDDPRLRLVGTCNELNAGFAADGYSRATGGLACVVVTYMVGSLSMLSAAAGALAEDVPVLVVCGGPNSTDCALRRVVHHSVGQVDLFHSSRCFSPVVEATFIVRGLENAAEMYGQRPIKHQL